MENFEYWDGRRLNPIKDSIRLLMHKTLLKTSKYNKNLSEELYCSSWGTFVVEFICEKQYLSLEIADGVIGWFTDGSFVTEKDNIPLKMIDLLLTDLKLLFGEK